MFSEYSDNELVMKAVCHGASEFLVKPVRLEELKTIWQHVIRKKKDNEDLSAQKKSQSLWSVELHHKFVAAVNQLGIDSMFSTLSARQTIFISYQFPRALPNFISHFTLSKCFLIYFQPEVEKNL